MKRIAIFAHFDKQNIIDPYVITYLKELRKYCEIVFVSDGSLQDQELGKIENICLDVISGKHGEYDFGSYKRGFQLIQNKYSQKLQEIDELLFVNDSCYLVGDFKDIFSDMEQKEDCDYWGLTDNYNNFHKDRTYYISSYFIVFRKTVFLEEFFSKFVNSVTRSPGHKKIVTKYEYGMSVMLQKNEMKPFAFFSVKTINQSIIDNYITFSDQIIGIFSQNLRLKYRNIVPFLNRIFNIYSLNYLHSDKFFFLLANKFPLLKRKVIQYEQFPKENFLHLWREILDFFAIDQIECIDEHSKRIGVKLKNRKNIEGMGKVLCMLSNQKIFYIKKYEQNNKNYFVIKIVFFKFKLPMIRKL